MGVDSAGKFWYNIARKREKENEDSTVKHD